MKLKTLLPMLLLAGCFAKASEPASLQQVNIVAEENAIPGTVSRPYVEPMIDVVKVPARLDPEGVYYLPEHQEVVEIRPQRFEEVQFGGEVREDRRN